MWFLNKSFNRRNWLLFITLSCLFLAWLANAGIHPQDVEDNEFAEFEDFEVEEPGPTVKDQEAPPVQDEPEEEEEPKTFEPDEDEATVETEDNEFEAVDEDEFEGYNGQQKSQQDKTGEGPKLTFAKLPAHLRSNWESYYMELLILSGLLVYFLNYFMGRSKNQKIAEVWYESFKSLLEENFDLVGDDGKIENSNPGLIKESENVYLLWCSGRSGCEGMLVEMRLKKRQDLISVLSGLVRPQQDKVVVKVFMNEEDMDTFVLCLANKKSATKLSKELADLSVFCPEKKAVDKFGLPASFVLLSEIGEVASSFLDTRVCGTINKFPDLVDSLHLSDQYSGPKLPEDTAPSKMPDVKKMLIFTFNLAVGSKSVQDAIEAQRPGVQLVFYVLDRVKRFRLSKEAKTKAEKNRQKVEEAFLKSTHMARAEAAAARREERRKQEKEKILQDDDPEKQRKWEEKEAKRLAKRKMPKMKAIRV